MSRPPEQFGSGVIEALLILAVVVVLGGAGWYVWMRERSSKTSTAQKGSHSTTMPTPKPTPVPAPTPTPDSGYLVIKDLGVKVKLAEASKVTYTIGGTPNGSSPNADGIVAWATIQLNTSFATSDKCRSVGYELDQLTAATNGVEIGNYYYGFNGTSAPCGDSAVDPLRAQIAAELVSSAISPE